jgi:hypothetical protein
MIRYVVGKIYMYVYYLVFTFYPYVLFRHGGHDGWSAGSSDISFKGNPLRMIQAKFGLNSPNGFRGEDF